MRMRYLLDGEPRPALVSSSQGPTMTDADDFDELLTRPKCFAYQLAVRARGEYISTHQTPTDSVEKEGENHDRL